MYHQQHEKEKLKNQADENYIADLNIDDGGYHHLAYCNNVFYF